MAGQTQPAAFTALVKQGSFDADVENAINSTLTNLQSVAAANATDAISASQAAGQTIASALTVTGALTLNSPLPVQVASGAADVIAFTHAINICVVTSTGPDSATLATPAAGDQGKILILINTNTTQNVVTTSAGKIVIGTGTTYNTLTAPAHAGGVALLIAANLLWNAAVLGTGEWVLGGS